jgi:hypothetical protein
MTEHSFQSRDFTVLHSTRVCLPRARSRAGDEGISPLRWDEICLGFWRCFCFVVTFSCANDQTESPHTVQYIILWVPRSPFFLLIESDVGKGSRSMKLSLSLETNTGHRQSFRSCAQFTRIVSTPPSTAMTRRSEM